MAAVPADSAFLTVTLHAKTALWARLLMRVSIWLFGFALKHGCKGRIDDGPEWPLFDGAKLEEA